jgi:hypothetical protein
MASPKEPWCLPGSLNVSPLRGFTNHRYIIGPGPHVLCLSKAGPKALDGGVVMSLCRSFGKPPFHYGCWGSILYVGYCWVWWSAFRGGSKKIEPSEINRIPPLKGRAPHLVFQHRSATSYHLDPRIDLRLLLVTGKVTPLN